MDTNPVLRYVTASLKVDLFKADALGGSSGDQRKDKRNQRAEGSDGNHGQGRGEGMRPRGSCSSANA
jgi:hypothetical protein